MAFNAALAMSLLAAEDAPIFTQLKVAIFVILILSISLHEYGHATSARLLGDDLALSLGRCSLNPLRHLDPVFSVILPAVLLFTPQVHAVFGAGKPVPVDPSRLKRPAFDLMLISVAGPMVNVVLAVAFTIAYHVAVARGMKPLSDEGLIFMWGVRLNLLLALFNMLPVPPLDGHRVLALFMPRPVRERFYRMWYLGLAAIIYLMFFGGFALLQEHVLFPVSDFYRPYMPGEYDVFPR